jgi:hypothetical protein
MRVSPVTPSVLTSGKFIGIKIGVIEWCRTLLVFGD